MTQADLDAKLARVFATPEGRELLSEPWETLSRAEVEAAIERMRRRWATGAPGGADSASTAQVAN